MVPHINDVFDSLGPGSSLPILVVLLAGTILVRHAICAFTGPLSKVPGPKWNALTNVPYLYSIWQGKEVEYIAALHKSYGPIVRVTPSLVAVLGDGQAWKQIYGPKTKAQPSFDKDLLFYERPSGGTPGPITAESKTHARMRKTLSPAFSDQALKRYEPQLKHWAGCFKVALERKAKSPEPADMVKLLNCATFDIMSDLTFAEPLHMLEGGEYVPWVELIFNSLKLFTRMRAIRYFNMVASFLLDMLVNNTPSIVRTAREHAGYVNSRVDKRLAENPSHPDIWSRVDQEVGLSRDEHYAIANELMFAGTETTASALSGVVYFLLRSPAWLKRLTGELRSQYGSTEDLDMSSLQSNQVLNAVLQEGLRLYPPLPSGLPRIVPPGGTNVKDYFIPERTRIAIYHGPNYRNKEYFQDADSFRPERWLNDPQFKEDKLDAIEPFSVGPRNCVGKNFAWHEMRLLLATVLLHFDISLRSESQNWSDQKIFLVWDKKPLMCNLTVDSKQS